MTHYLDSVLNPGGKLPLFSAEFYRPIPTMDLIKWAYANAVYCFPTIELIDFLKNQIGENSAIEVGSGNNGLCDHLGIIGTDSYMQRRPEIMFLYHNMMGQRTTNPPSNVQKLEAKEAVDKHKPHTVVASWLTQIYKQDEDEKVGSSIEGADEEYIIDNVSCYILIGNRKVHGDKRILKLPHEEISPSWLVSRSQFPTENVIYIWRK